MPSSIWNGGVTDVLRTSAWSVRTSISPVASLVLVVSRHGAHDAVDLDGPLGTHGLGDLKGVAVGVLGVEGELRDALAVAKIAEDKAAVVAATAHPTGEGDLFAHVLAAKLAAGTGVHGMLVDGTGLAHTSDPPLWICAAPCRSGRRRTDLPSLRKPRSQTWRSILSHLCRCAAEK